MGDLLIVLAVCVVVLWAAYEIVIYVGLWRAYRRPQMAVAVEALLHAGERELLRLEVRSTRGDDTPECYWEVLTNKRIELAPVHRTVLI